MKLIIRWWSIPPNFWLSRKNSHSVFEIFFCHVPVLLYPHDIDQRSATGVNKDVEEGAEPVDEDEHHEGADRLKHPIEHVELHCHKVPVLSLVPYKIAHSLDVYILFPSKAALELIIFKGPF